MTADGTRTSQGGRLVVDRQNASRMAKGVAIVPEVRLLPWDAVDAARWTAFVDVSPDGTFFHTGDWMDLLIHSFRGWKGFVHVAQDGEGGWLAGLPWVRIRRYGIHAIHSMPFGTFAGPVALEGCPAEAVAAVCDAFHSSERSWGSRGVFLTHYRNRALHAARRELRRSFAVQGIRTQILDLTQGFPEVWNARFDRQRRRQARCGERRGVVVRLGEGHDDFLGYYASYRESSRGWERRNRPNRAFFENLARIDPRRVRLWVAEVDGRIVGGNVSFIYRDVAISWIGTMIRSFRRYHPAVALQRAAIRDACDMGCRSYHLGPSSGLEGVVHFKEQFGAEWDQYEAWSAPTRLGRILSRLRSERHRTSRGA